MSNSPKDAIAALPTDAAEKCSVGQSEETEDVTTSQEDGNPSPEGGQEKDGARDKTNESEAGGDAKEQNGDVDDASKYTRPRAVCV
jgi:hypothetical protein